MSGTGRHQLALVALLAAVVLGGCGYTLQGNLPDHLKTVSVPIFKNRTPEAGAETTIVWSRASTATTFPSKTLVTLRKATSAISPSHRQLRSS